MDQKLGWNLVRFDVVLSTIESSWSGQCQGDQVAATAAKGVKLLNERPHPIRTHARKSIDRVLGKNGVVKLSHQAWNGGLRCRSQIGECADGANSSDVRISQSEGHPVLVVQELPDRAVESRFAMVQAGDEKRKCVGSEVRNSTADWLQFFEMVRPGRDVQAVGCLATERNNPLAEGLSLV